MGLMERVSTLIRANLNDLIDRSEDPEKMLKQILLDMQNQLLQVKTQLAISVADQHLLEKKRKENDEKMAEWMRKAELAVDKKHDDLARAALERYQSCQRLEEGFSEQIEGHKLQVEALKKALQSLEQKIGETKSRAEMLATRHRRARAAGRANRAERAIREGASSQAFDRMRGKIVREEAIGDAEGELLRDDLDLRLAQLGREDEIDKLLAEVKARRPAAAS
ncbi:MAG TPA: PspA/IM30 family protein [Candidatus Acidoferrales bacterium]|nr:PspA/IM30 family protein [Candidatus Acidoferrales bacterium]